MFAKRYSLVMEKPTTYRIDIQPTHDGRYMARVTFGYTSKRFDALGLGDTPLAAAHDARAEMRLTYFPRSYC